MMTISHRRGMVPYDFPVYFSEYQIMGGMAFKYHAYILLVHEYHTGRSIYMIEN